MLLDNADSSMLLLSSVGAQFEYNAIASAIFSEETMTFDWEQIMIDIMEYPYYVHAVHDREAYNYHKWRPPSK